MCDQQSLRSACTYVQTDQRLCLSLEYSMTVKLLTEHHLEFLCLKGGCTGSTESTHVKMRHCWKSHVTAQLFNMIPFLIYLVTALGSKKWILFSMSSLLPMFVEFTCLVKYIFLHFSIGNNLTEKESAGPRSAVGNMSGYRCVSDCRSRGRKFDPGPVPYFRGD